jgi:hypothetical protein
VHQQGYFGGKDNLDLRGNEPHRMEPSDWEGLVGFVIDVSLGTLNSNGKSLIWGYLSFSFRESDLASPL